MIGGIEAAKSWANVVTAGVVLGMAVFVTMGGRQRNPVNARLGLLALLLAANLAGSLIEIVGLGGDPRISYNAILLAIATGGALGPAYLLFVSCAVTTPLVRPFASRVGQTALALWVVVALALPYLAPGALAPGPATTLHDGRLSWQLDERYGAFRNAALLASMLFALGCSIDAWRRAAEGSVARDRARAYAIAFGISDAAGILFLSALFLGASQLAFDVTYILTDVAIVATSALLARALLRHQLFDFDLRVKWTLRRGTLVGAFVAAFFVIAAIVEQYLQRFGVLAGGVAVGLLLFALRPLERAADQFASAAMPGVTGSPEYVAYRKLQVYRATVENAIEDGDLTPKERAMLDVLARELGIRAEDARAVEAEVVT